MDEKEMLLLQNIGSLDRIRDLNNQLLLMLEKEHAKSEQRKLVIQYVEWVNEKCPWCGAWEDKGHHWTCERQKALED